MGDSCMTNKDGGKKTRAPKPAEAAGGRGKRRTDDRVRQQATVPVK